MFDKFLIRENSLQNVVQGDKITGFRFAVRIADYRGCFLSLHNGYYIVCDGVEYPKNLQRFEINGKPPRSFDEIMHCVWEHWNYDDEGYVYVQEDGGLAPGAHIIGIQQSVLSQYGYMAWDEDWVKNPPIPGRGAGFGKTPVVCEFELKLQDLMHREGV
jgi:hypothetical protein